MTSEQKQKAIEVIRKDATLRCAYVGDNNGESCVLGGLLLAVGFDREKLKQVNGKWIGEPLTKVSGFEPSNSQMEILEEMRQTLQKEYGIDYDLAVKLQRINDSQVVVTELSEKRTALIELLS